MLADNNPTLLDYIKDIIFFLLYSLHIFLLMAITVFYIYSIQYALYSMIVDPQLPWWSWIPLGTQVFWVYMDIKMKNIRPTFRLWVIMFIFAVINMAMVAIYNPAGFDIEVRIPPGTFRF